MTPGPNRILKTPSGALVKVTSIGSGNNFGARYWTDGKCEAPMLPNDPWLRRNPETGELFWTDACEEVAQEEPWDAPAGEYGDTPFAESPTSADFLRAIETGLASSSEKEQYIRVRYWWLANDPFRLSPVAHPDDSSFRQNLVKLRLLLTDTDPGQRLMAAEIYRELGDFPTASALLNDEYPEGMAKAVNLVRQLTAASERRVSEIIW